MGSSRTLGRAVAALAAAAICGLTLSPVPASAAAAAATPLLCLVCGDRGGADVTLNILLFMPLGFGLRLAGGSWKPSVLVAALLSLGIELLQFTVVPGRDASLSDLLTNTAGSGLGALLAARIGVLLRPSPHQAWRLLAGAAAALVALASAAAWLETPDTGEALVDEWGGSPGPEVFGGTVESVVLDGIRVSPEESPEDSSRLTRSLPSGQTTLEAHVVTGPMTSHRRWIYRIGPRHNPNGYLSQDGRTAVLGLPARSLRLLLNPPSVMLREGFPADSGVAVTIRAEQRHGTMRIESEYGRERHAIAVGLSPAAAWVLVAPFGLALGGPARLITAAVVFLVLAPLGYWSRAVEPDRRGLLVAGAALLLGLAVVPAAAGLPPVHWSEWLAGVLGCAFGWALFPAAANLHARCGSPSTSESFSS